MFSLQIKEVNNTKIYLFNKVSEQIKLRHSFRFVEQSMVEVLVIFALSSSVTARATTLLLFFPLFVASVYKIFLFMYIC